MSPLSILKTLPLLILLTLPTAILSSPTPAPQDPCQPRGPPGPPGTPGNPPSSGCPIQAPAAAAEPIPNENPNVSEVLAEAPQPEPGTSQPDTDSTEILPQYQILFAQVNSSRVEIGNTTLTDSKMNITVSGTQPGNLPVKCFGEWMFDSAREKLTYAQLPCEDPSVEVGLNQVREEHPGIEVAVGVSVK
ncbi:MAG: hypothetical protein Q9204_005679 [Flavoplaca sp. TL-2023a]